MAKRENNKERFVGHASDTGNGKLNRSGRNAAEKLKSIVNSTSKSRKK